MAKKNVLITGGAGFIGLNLANKLLKLGYSIRILDNLLPQVHGINPATIGYLSKNFDFVHADINDQSSIDSVISGIDVIVHLAALTGLAQSMYEIGSYVQTNVQATANMLQRILTNKTKVQKIVVASSRAIYGEGKYVCSKCGVVYPDTRSNEMLKKGFWESICPICGSQINTVSSDEKSLPKPTSIYAATKLMQEQMCTIFGSTYDIPTIALRYQNVYGEGQSLKNPYTGVLSMFCLRIRSGKPILVYEDGGELRDFVHVNDVVRATILALESPLQGTQVFNVGSGKPVSILEAALLLFKTADKEPNIKITGTYRVGDIRHCYADLTQVRAKLGYEPDITLESGLRRLLLWVDSQPFVEDALIQATKELEDVGLYRSSKIVPTSNNL